jgi:hypothetical protein
MTEAVDAPPEILYQVVIRWARERGWIQVRDAFTGEFHEVHQDQCPRWWRRQAQLEKLRSGGFRQ